MATFSLDEDQRQIKDSMDKFAVAEMRPIARHCDEEAVIPQGFLENTWGLGLAVNIIPEKYGGYEFGRSALNNVIIAEALAYGDLSLALAAIAPNLFVLPIMEMGTEQQKEAYLPAFCKDNYTVGTLAIMEHSLGFDAFSLRTRAESRGGAYVLNGEKCMVPMAEDASYILVLAATDDGGAGFIVEKGTQGLVIGNRERNMGLNALPLYPLALKDCTVPAGNRLEMDAAGYARLLSLSRVGLSAAAVGLSHAVMDYSITYAKEREAFGKPIATRQAIAFMLADMAIEVEGLRLLSWKAAWSADNKADDMLRLGYLAKSYSAEQAFKIADYGVSILGGHGLIREHMVELWFRNARAFAMLEGMVVV